MDFFSPVDSVCLLWLLLRGRSIFSLVRPYKKSSRPYIIGGLRWNDREGVSFLFSLPPTEEVFDGFSELLFV